MFIIGITGTFASGKGLVASYLKEKKGFMHFSSRAFIVKFIKKEGLEVNRDNMMYMANKLRKISPSFIMENFVNKMTDNNDYVIESIRTTGEVKYLKNIKNFMLLFLTADPKIRYERAKKRKSSTDKVTYEQFLQSENIEMRSEDPNKINLADTFELADVTIKNDSTIEDLYKEIDTFLKEHNI